ncbi:MAG: V-type ATPase 116kDa subunit family protein [Candidatus Pacebacteria bacterium]|nr:V-type ATPase 116kDa subunit family protein [Candidatus Paceibacterota bacterium]
MLKVAKKYILAFPKESRNKISAFIANSGAFEVIENKQEAKEEEVLKNLQNAGYKLATMDFAIGFLAPFTKKLSFIAKLKSSKALIGGDFREGGEQERIFQQAKRIEKIEKKFDILKKEGKDAQSKLIELEKFNALSFKPQDTQTTFFLVGAIYKTQKEKFIAFGKENKLFQKQLATLQAKETYLIAGLKENKEKVLFGLKSLKGEVIAYNFEQSPIQERVNIQAKVEENVEVEKALRQELSLMAKDIEKFKIYRDILEIEKINWEIKNKTLFKGILDYVVFWGYEKEVKDLKEKVSSFAKDFNLIEVASGKGEEPRVVLENHKLVRPFQYVTEIFGMPKPGEVDPTPYLALFFIIFFGVCLTDAGYGILLVVFTLPPLLFLKNKLGDTKLMQLLFYGGISTLIMGILFGSYFGSTTQTLQKFPFLYRLKMIDPIEDTILFMGLSFGIGYLQVAFAQIIKMITGKRGKNKEMFINGLAWLIFYIALIIFALSKVKVPQAQTIATVFLVLSVGFLLIGESFGQKIFLKPLVGSIKILQGIIGTMSDVLSYSRLVALGLSTAVIALIVNQIAFLLGGMVPYVGWILTGLVLIGGHIFNLGINALGAFIHSGRLQFVEFFPKFLEGGGKRFNPIKAELKYSRIQ